MGRRRGGGSSADVDAGASARPRQAGTRRYSRWLGLAAVAAGVAVLVFWLMVQLLLPEPSLSSPQVLVRGGTIIGEVRVSGTGGVAGTLRWWLVGPVAVGPSGSCDSADLRGAPTIARGEISVPGDGVYTTRPQGSLPRTGGCVGFRYELSAGLYGSTPRVGPASSSTSFLASSPVISALDVSQASGQLKPSVAVLGTMGAPGTLTWRARGPVPVPAAGCIAATYPKGLVFASGKVEVTGDGSFDLGALTSPANPGCLRFTATLAGIGYAQSARLAPGRVDGYVATGPVGMGSVFLDALGTTRWFGQASEATGGVNWQLRSARSVGISRVILQQTAVVKESAGAGGVDLITTAYPAPGTPVVSPGYGTAGFGGAQVLRSTVGNADSNEQVAGVDEVGSLLNAADAVGGVRVVLGLSNSAGMWALPQSTTQTSCVVGRDAGCAPSAWMQRQVDYAEQVALEVYQVARGHGSFGGWYLPLEFAPSSWATPGAISDLVYLYGQVSAFLQRLSPYQPITIAPYIDPLPASAALPAYPGCQPFTNTVLGATTISPWNTPCQAEVQLERVLAGTGVTELLLQDGLGDPKATPYIPMTLRMLRRWNTAAVEAAAAASAVRGVRVSTSLVTDLYARDAYDISPTQYYDALTAAAGATPATTGFCWAHLDPSASVNADLFSAVRQVAAGQKPSGVAAGPQLKLSASRRITRRLTPGMASCLRG